ncbi:uncharacterized protein LOC131688019 [Topomyia yanbarensis]|uniref:uncharacterized protein LOC131688019 n=1 Tax=Topomyia yanbarensis TaxID=2498891 RepID=UPI00273B3A26|nr:uncharacterized protein LOC131688019 [Topomyia yanbarensis]
MKNQIDHICISRKWRRSLLDVRNKRSADIASDHHLLISEILLRIARIHRQEDQIGRRFNTRRLEDAAARRYFVEELENHAADIPAGGSVEDQWTAIKNAFITTGENNLGELHTQRKQWTPDGTWKKIEERRDAKAAIERAKTRGAKAAARQHYSALEKQKKDKRAWADSVSSTISSGTKIMLRCP